MPIDPEGHVNDWNEANEVRTYLANKYPQVTFSPVKTILLPMGAGRVYQIDTSIEQGAKPICIQMSDNEPISVLKSTIETLIAGLPSL